MPPLARAPSSIGTPPGTAAAQAAASSMGGVRVSVFSDMQTFVDNRTFLTQIIGQYHVFNVDYDAKVVTEDLLNLIQYILRSSIQFVDRELLGKKVADETFEEPEFLKAVKSFEGVNAVPSSHVINRILCQITCKALGAKNAEKALRVMFDSVSSYSWPKKMVLILAAFAVLYGDFWVVAGTKGPNALSVSVLKGYRAFDLRKHRAYVENLNELAKQLLELTASLLELHRYTTVYLEKEVPALGMSFALIPEWICQTIISIVSVAAQFSSFTNFEERHWTWGLSHLPNAVNRILIDVKKHLNECKTQIDEMNQYNMWVKRIESPLDIVELLTALFGAFKSEDPPLLNGTTKEPVRFEYFRRKNVYLVISSWKISEDDVKALLNVYRDPIFLQKPPAEEAGMIAIEGAAGPTPTTERAYEIVWVPALDAPLTYTTEVSNLRASMPWIVAKNASVVHRFAVRFFRENWHFSREPIVVALNYSGWVECLNAVPMIRMWGIQAFPFTEREIPGLLAGKTWLELVMVPIFPRLHNWVTNDKYILFVGGAQKANTSLHPDIERKISDAIGSSFISVPLDSEPLVRQFLFRLENYLYLKMQTALLLPDGSVSDPLRDTDIQQMFQTFTAHERGGFAILTRGYHVLTVTLFTTAWKVLGEHEKWLRTVSKTTTTMHSNFGNVFIKLCEEVDSPTACRFYYCPALDGLTPSYMKCPVCYQLMRSVHKFECCHD